jgi:hypothetical protein
MRSEQSLAVDAGRMLVFLFLLTLPLSAFAQEVRTISDLPEAGTPLYVGNKQPLLPARLIKLPITSITPRGWLRHQLDLMRDGMTGRLSEISPWLKFEGNAWTDPRGREMFPLDFPEITCDPGVFEPTQGSLLMWKYLYREGIGAHQRCFANGVPVAARDPEQIAFDVDREAAAERLRQEPGAAFLQRDALARGDQHSGAIAQEGNRLVLRVIHGSTRS